MRNPKCKRLFCDFFVHSQMLWVSLVVLTLSFTIERAHALSAFSSCRSDCVSEQKCDPGDQTMNLFGWSCAEECSYSCYDHLRKPVYSKHEGAWPLTRV